MVRQPWCTLKVEEKKSLKIGYFKSHSLFPVSGANQRAVEEAKIALEALGHTLVECRIPNFEDICLTYCSLISLLSFIRINDARKNETLVKGKYVFFINSRI